MKISPELKIGLLAAICIAITVWGYQFMRGKNILIASNFYYAEYDDIDELAATSPVLIRGLKVGIVKEVSLSDDMQSVIATLDIERGIKIPKTTQALVVSTGIMGGRAVVLDLDKPCTGADCAKRGDFLEGRVLGMFESMFAGSDLNEYTAKLKKSLGEVISSVGDSISGPEAEGELAETYQDLRTTISNIANITGRLSGSIDNYDRNVRATLGNLNKLSGTLADNNDKIASTLANMEQISTQLKNADLGKTADNANSALSEAQQTFASLGETLEQAQATFGELNTVIAGMQAGEGSLGKLLQDPELYDNLNRTSHNLDLLLQDVRLNPKRYINVALIGGKKQVPYALPEEDPAFNGASDEVSPSKKKKKRRN